MFAALLPQSCWPSSVPRASMNVRKEDWPQIASSLAHVKRYMLTPFPYEEIGRACVQLVSNEI